MVLLFRNFQQSDWPDVWAILQPTFAEGLSYPCDLDISETNAHNYWVGATDHVIIAEEATTSKIVGTYYIRRDQAGPGDHICNCGYVVAPDARGNGYASALCEDSQLRARDLGFKGMKFNLVVVSNLAAVKAWQKAGFKILGTTPAAFRLPSGDYSDAHIMFKSL